MRKRLLLSLAFGAVGLAAAPVVADVAGISSMLALTVGGTSGAVLGCIVSIFVDVFVAPSNTAEN